MTATPTRAGTMTHDYEVAACKFANYPKHYHYWVPKAWNLQPGDVIKVSAPSGFATVVHSGEVIPTGAHKLALGLHKRAEPKPIVMDEWPTDPPSRITLVGKEDMIADMKVFTDGPMPDQMAYYRQAFAATGTTRTGRWAGAPLDSNIPKDTTMEIQNQTLVNGRNIKDMTDDQLFDLIAAEEAKIKALRAIENKPQKLKDRINKMQADIETLIKLIDER